jgi:hypothetical protein
MRCLNSTGSDSVAPSREGHEWSAIAAAENALNAIDQQIDLSKYWCVPDNTLLDLTREALRLCKKARDARGVPVLDGKTVFPPHPHGSTKGGEVEG